MEKYDYLRVWEEWTLGYDCIKKLREELEGEESNVSNSKCGWLVTDKDKTKLKQIFENMTVRKYKTALKFSVNVLKISEYPYKSSKKYIKKNKMVFLYL